MHIGSDTIVHVFELSPPPPASEDLLDSPESFAAELAGSPPSPDDAVVLSQLDPAALSHAGRVDLLAALERQAAWLAAVQQRVLAAMAGDAAAAGDAVDRSGRQWVREDVACALRLSGVTAQRRLDVAQALAERLPGTLALLDRGQISYLYAASLAEAVDGLDGEQATAVEDRVLARAAGQTLAEFRRSVGRAVAAVA